jgi:hypothetical protein
MYFDLPESQLVVPQQNRISPARSGFSPCCDKLMHSVFFRCFGNGLNIPRKMRGNYRSWGTSAFPNADASEDTSQNHRNFNGQEDSSPVYGEHILFSARLGIHFPLPAGDALVRAGVEPPPELTADALFPQKAKIP